MSKNPVSRKESRLMKGIFSSKKNVVEKRPEISPPTSGYRPGVNSIATTDLAAVIPGIPRLPTSLPTSPPSLATVTTGPSYQRNEFLVPSQRRDSASRSFIHPIDAIPVPHYERPPSLTPASTPTGTFHDLILTLNNSPRTPARYSSRLELDLLSRDVRVEPEQIGPVLEVPPRTVVLYKSQTGDFGFSMNRCDPDEIPYHILEPRNTSTTQNGLISGDRLVEVNSYNVEQSTHDQVVDIIRKCGDSVELQVVAPPELYELAIRGALVPPTNQGRKTSTAVPHRRKSFHQRTVHSNFIGRMQKKSALRLRSAILEPSDTPGLHWLVHKEGYCGVVPVEEPVSGSTGSLVGLGRYNDLKRSTSGLIDGYRVKVIDTGHVLSVDQDDVSPAQNIVHGIENLAELTYLNETNCLHVLRTRYANSLVHTYAGRHLIVINPIRELKCYSERVIEMFRGCQKDDMPPHIFSVAQTAYSEMRFSRQDQTFILQGTSGSGKTYNARFLFAYLSTVAAYPQSELNSDKFIAAEVLLLSMGSASTRINGQATRFTNFTSLQFDSLGRLVSAVITPYLLERNRVVDPPPGEQNYNIFYQLYFSAEEQLSAELLLNQNYAHDKPHLNFDDISLDSAEYNYLWNLIQHSLKYLGISEEEARGIWSLLAAVYHLGHAGGTATPKGTGKFNDPVAAHNAATTLGTNVDTLQQELFYHMNTGRASYSSSSGVNSPSASLSSNSSAGAQAPGARAQAAVKWFMIGLYEHAFHAMVLLINRALKGASSHNKTNVTSINILDTPGFQNYSSASETASFDDLCHNYTQERLQMLFFDYSFTRELDRYMEEEVPWTFSETPMSPLRIIDAIDKNASHPKYSTDLSRSDPPDTKGLFWILDEESSYPGSSDQILIDQIKTNFKASSQSHSHSRVAPPLLVYGENKFLIAHFQNSYPVTYNVTNWLERVRENHSIRSVPAILSSSKRPPIAAIFQGKGIAAASLNLSSQDGPLSKRYNTRRKSQVLPGVPSSSKKSSVPLLTKFYLDFIMDEIRKSNQFFICCIVPHPPESLPLGSNATEFNVPIDDFNIPFVRKQLKAGELLKATRIFKQGYPEMMHYSEFLRRFCILEQGRVSEYSSQKEHARELLEKFLELDKLKYKLGQSKIFFRVGTLHQINSVLEERTNHTLINLQAVCRGYLTREHFKDLKVQELAIKCIQRNVKVFFDLKGSMWWDLMNEMKPMLEMKKSEDENRKLRDKLESLSQKLEHSERELNAKIENEHGLDERIVALTQDLGVESASSQELQYQLSNLELANREQRETIQSLQKSLQTAAANSEALKEENAKLAVKTSYSGDVTLGGATDQEEVESLKQKLSQYKIELEEASIRKKKLESQLKAIEKERDDFSGGLEQFRRRFNKVNSELTDARIHGEEQASKYSELDKRQRRHETELSTAREAAASEKQARDKLTREKAALEVEAESLRGEYKSLEEQRNKLRKSNEEMQLSSSAHATNDQHELSELRRGKNALELQVADLEEERDELSLQTERVGQEKQRVELEIQTVRRQNMRDTEALEEEVEKSRASHNKKVKNLEQQIEEEREDKSALLRNKRDMEIELQQLRSEPSFDSVAMQKLRKKLILTRALLDDAQSELKGERDKCQKAKAACKSSVSQVEEGQTQVQVLTRKLRNLNQELEECKDSSEKLHMGSLDLGKQLAEATRGKEDAETQLEELDEDYKEERLKHSSIAQQLRLSQTEISCLQESVISLEGEKKRLEAKLCDMDQQLKKETDSKRKLSNPASEGKVRELELKVEQESNQKKRLEKTNHRLQSNHDKLQTELEQLKEHDHSKKLLTDIKKLRASLQEAEEREELALKKKREAERQLNENEQELEEKSDQLRSLNQRADKLKKTMETDFDEDLTIDDELSTSFEESPQISRHFPYARNSTLGLHQIDNDFDIPRHSNHKHTSSDLIDSDDSMSVRSSHSRSSSRHDYDVTNNTNRRLPHLTEDELYGRGNSLLTHSRHSPTDFLPSRAPSRRPTKDSTLEDNTVSRTSELITKFDSIEEINKVGLGSRPNSSASSRIRSTLEKTSVISTDANSRTKSDLQFSDTDSVSSFVSSRTGATDLPDDPSGPPPIPKKNSISSRPISTDSEARRKLLEKREKRKKRTFQQENANTNNFL